VVRHEPKRQIRTLPHDILWQLGGDVEEQFFKACGRQTETFTETHIEATGTNPHKVVKTMKKKLVGTPGLEPFRPAEPYT
jgi:hypothetical protein